MTVTDAQSDSWLWFDCVISAAQQPLLAKGIETVRAFDLAEMCFDVSKQWSLLWLQLYIT